MSELLPLKPDDFDQLKVIGKGAFSKVFLVRHRRTGLICAMKKINKQQVVESDCLDGMKTERELLARAIDFPFIVDLYFAFETVTHWYLCMEFCAGGEVYTLITHEGRWVEYPKVQHYAAELVLAIEWLHHHKFMHRDLKCENIMISQEGHTKLIDFGVSAGAMPVLTPAYIKPRKIQMNVSAQSLGDVSCASIDYETVTDDEEESICIEHKNCRCHSDFGKVKASNVLLGSIESMAPEMLTEE